MRSLCYFLVLLLKLDHVVFEFQNLFFFGVVYVLHFDDPVFEDFVGFLQLFYTLLEASDGLVFLDSESLDTGILTRQLLASPHLFSQPPT